MSKRCLLLLFCIALVSALPGRSVAITVVDPFPPTGEGGLVNGQDLLIGAGGDVFELDSFFAVGGPPSAPPSAGLPPGVLFRFDARLSADTSDLFLEYSFVNRSGSDIADFRFFSFLDADIDAAQNGFFNEFGTVLGAPGPGQGFEIDEPGFVFGDIVDNILLNAQLDDTNAIPAQSPDDVSMALSFGRPLLDGASVHVRILISEDGDRIGSLALQHEDPDSTVPTEITYSGQAAARIIIRKELVSRADASFSFGGAIEATLGQGETSSVLVAPGVHRVFEIDDPADNWELLEIECDGPRSFGDVTARTATFDVEEGDTVTCVFRNFPLKGGC